MRNSAFAIVLVSLLAVSQSGVINEPLDYPAPYLIDSIIKAILESLKPKFANLKFDPINETVQSPDFNASVLVNDISLTNLDKFVTKNLKSSIAPLKLVNLTLTWEQVTGAADYDVKATIAVPPTRTPFNVFGKGQARANLNKIFFTVGANMELKNAALQIKPKGLFGFDVKIGNANVTLSSLMGSTELGDAIGVFVSKMIPELVDTLKKPVFEAFQDDIIKFVNQILKKNGTYMALDEQPSVPDHSMESLDLSEEMNQFANEFDMEEFQLDSEF